MNITFKKIKSNYFIEDKRIGGKLPGQIALQKN
jgi:hypothetical protein